MAADYRVARQFQSRTTPAAAAPRWGDVTVVGTSPGRAVGRAVRMRPGPEWAEAYCAVPLGSRHLPLPEALNGWHPGDLYTMRLGGRLPHIGIVSDKRTPAGQPYVIHNIGGGTQEEDILGLYDDERRFRFEVSDRT